MNLTEELHAAVAEVANNPKMSAVVSTTTAWLGLASVADWISGALSSLAIIVGIIVTAMLGRVHFQTSKNLLLDNKIKRKQLIDLGGDPDGEN